MSDTHAARPTDLVALVTFDGEVRENQAVTREAIGREPDTPRPLSAALEQWLGLGRQTWVTVEGRAVQGIATARDLSKGAWILDTLIDADCAGGDGHVLRDLLRQAARAAEHARVTHILLRTPVESPAIEAALRAGFVAALHERLWRGRTLDALAPDAAGLPEAHGTIIVRPAVGADTFGLFQLYNRALPLEARQALAMTLDEWTALRERRWCARGGGLVALAEDRIVGALRIGSDDERTQVELMLDPGPGCAVAGRALLDAAAARAGARAVLALVPLAAAATERALRERGLEPSTEYVLLSRRVARPVRELARAHAGVVIPSRG